MSDAITAFDVYGLVLFYAAALIGYLAFMDLVTGGITGEIERPRLRAVLLMLAPIFPVGLLLLMAVVTWELALVPLGRIYRRLWGEAFPRGAK